MEIKVDKQYREVISEECGDIRIELQDGADYELLCCGTHSGRVEARLAKDSKLKITFVDVDGVDFERLVQVDLDGEGAECELAGVTLASGEQTSKIVSNVNHNVPNTKSDQNFRAVASGTAHSYFSGLIYVKKGADQTLALQQSDNVLLSDDAKINTDPQMEIYADDVKCNHGATVGRRDEEALFYMRQRGISEKDAQAFLLESFCFAKIDLKNYTEEVQSEMREKISHAISNM